MHRAARKEGILHAKHPRCPSPGLWLYCAHSHTPTMWWHLISTDPKGEVLPLESVILPTVFPLFFWNLSFKLDFSQGLFWDLMGTQENAAWFTCTKLAGLKYHPKIRLLPVIITIPFSLYFHKIISRTILLRGLIWKCQNVISLQKMRMYLRTWTLIIKSLKRHTLLLLIGVQANLN